jgi:hypothetical protein
MEEIESEAQVERFTSCSELDDAQRCRQFPSPAIRDATAFAATVGESPAKGRAKTDPKP